MALESVDLELLASLRKRFPRGSRLGILGDCEFHFDNATLAKHFPGVVADAHKSTLQSFSSALGFETAETIDLHGSPTHLVNLEGDLPSPLIGRFDWVIDAGTLFWCFDQAAVFRNILSMLAPDGCVMHVSALTGYFGRGYYSLQPRLFRDLYNANGFEVVTMGTRTRPDSVSAPWWRVGPLRRSAAKPTWTLMSSDSVFLGDASRSTIEFSERPARGGSEPAVLPNNAVVMCFASRVGNVAFSPPNPLGN